MKYIDKDYTTSDVQTHNNELNVKSLDENSLLNLTNYPGQTGRNLWHLIRDIKVIPHFWNLKHQMMKEQGGICCYCGLKIAFDGDSQFSKATVEHLIPKGLQRELVGEYKNLLLSCSLTQQDKTDVTMGICTTSDVTHCGDAKQNKRLNYTPLQSDCHIRFAYDIRGNVKGTDSKSKTDIDTLNLNCTALVDRRKNAMEILFVDDINFISDSELKIISNNILARQSDGNFREFCFVIKSVVDDLLNSKP